MTSIYPFCPLNLLESMRDKFRENKLKWVEIECNTKMYNLLNKYIAKNITICDNKIKNNLNSGCSFTVRSNIIEPIDCRLIKRFYQKNDDKFVNDIETSGLNENKFDYINISAGIGHFYFNDFSGNKLYGMHQLIGQPVGSCGSIKQMTNWVIFTTHNDTSIINNLLNKILQKEETTSSNSFFIYKWFRGNFEWEKEAACIIRPIDSVILPIETKKRIMSDIEKFLSPTTAKFYSLHGIPYRRSYLFHGIPGTGKSSFIQALASHYKRCICYLQPAQNGMDDENIRTAILNVPEKAIIVIEDITYFFGIQKFIGGECIESDKKGNSTNVTVSGLLNALDGITSCNGQLFILTTNHRDELDPVLIRHGRIDLEVKFTYATVEQMIDMWNSFYPNDTTLAQNFVDNVSKHFKHQDIKIVTSTLQNFFVINMNLTAKEALEQAKKGLFYIPESFETTEHNTLYI